MVQETLLYHSSIIKILIVLLLFNVTIALIFKKESVALIQAVRITTFLYFGLLAMAAFSGMILFLLGKFSWSLSLSYMVFVLFILIGVEISKIKKIKILWISAKSIFQTMFVYSLVEIALIASIIVWMVAQ